jgi:hypothetical protein
MRFIKVLDSHVRQKCFGETEKEGVTTLLAQRAVKRISTSEHPLVTTARIDGRHFVLAKGSREMLRICSKQDQRRTSVQQAS